MLFFTAVNPGIVNGGAFLVPKDEIYNKFPDSIVPKTLVVNASFQRSDIMDWMKDEQVSFPLLLKPNHGLRGIGLSIVKNETALYEFLNNKTSEYLIQEFIEFKNELGIFFTKDPKTRTVKVTSIVKKAFMQLIGDGIQTIEELIRKNSRYAMQLESIKMHNDYDWSRVLSQGEVLDFDRIGNHSRGAVFLDGQDMITPGLTEVVSSMLSYTEEVYYGRIDIKYLSDEALSNGEHYRIIELNGAFSEPAHIYDPAHSIFYAWKVIIQHFSYVFNISKVLIDQGVRPLTFIKGVQLLSEHFKITRILEEDASHSYSVA
jgi:hypothetical protein